MGVSATISVVVVFDSSSFWPGLNRPHEVKESEEVAEDKQSWESIVPPRDAG